MLCQAKLGSCFGGSIERMSGKCTSESPYKLNKADIQTAAGVGMSGKGGKNAAIVSVSNGPGRSGCHNDAQLYAVYA